MESQSERLLQEQSSFIHISRKLIIQEFKVRYKEVNIWLKKAIFTYIHKGLPSIGIPVLFSSGTKQFLFPTFLSRVTYAKNQRECTYCLQIRFILF